MLTLFLTFDVCQVGDLKHNKEQSVLAQRWADHLAATHVLKHSNDTYKGQPLGENVATKWSSDSADYTGELLKVIEGRLMEDGAGG